MRLNTLRSHNLPMLNMPNPANEWSLSTPNDEDPHTPLPHTPLAYDQAYPMSMTPTPTDISFDESVHGFGAPLSLSASSAGMASSYGSIASSSWSSDFVAGSMEEDEEVWTDREDGILESFLNKPLHPVSTPYPPSTLPPSGALDELTSQILHFHRPEDTPSTSMSTSTSLPSLTSSASSGTTAPSISACKSKSHSRSRSLSTQPWTHTWRSTRQRLFQIARKEAIGGNREDRWKGRTEGGQSLMVRGGVSVPGGMIVRMEDGVMRMQRHGSYSALDIDCVAEDAEEMDVDEQAEEDRSVGVKSLGQVLRLSTSLQRSSRISPQMMGNSSEMRGQASLSPVISDDMAPSSSRRISGSNNIARKPSLLQRGRSFTAEDFDTYMSLSTSPTRKASLASSRHPSLHVEVESDNHHMFCDEGAALITPSRAEIARIGRTHARTTSETSTIMGDDRVLSTPSPERGPSAPAITLTQNSPSPDDRSDDKSLRGWNFDMDTPKMEKGDPFAQALQQEGLGLGRPPAFMAGRHRPPPLHRSFSSSDASQHGPSALTEFMGPNLATSNNHSVKLPPAFNQPSKNGNLGAAWGLPLGPTSHERVNQALSLAFPLSKRQKVDMAVAVPLIHDHFLGAGAALDDGGLRSPFDEYKRF